MQLLDWMIVVVFALLTFRARFVLLKAGSKVWQAVWKLTSRARHERRLEAERILETLALAENRGVAAYLAANQDQRVVWAVSGADSYDRSYNAWAALADCKQTFHEWQESCLHWDMLAAQHKRAGLGTVVEALCATCFASTVALMDDWLDDRYKLSAHVRRCVVGVTEPATCGCGICEHARRPRSQSHSYDSYGS